MKVNGCTNMRVLHAKCSKQWGPLFWSHKVTWHKCCWKPACPFMSHRRHQTAGPHWTKWVSVWHFRTFWENPQIRNRRERERERAGDFPKHNSSTTACWKQAVKADTLPHSQPLLRVLLLITTMVFHLAAEPWDPWCTVLDTIFTDSHSPTQITVFSLIRDPKHNRRLCCLTPIFHPRMTWRSFKWSFIPKLIWLISFLKDLLTDEQLDLNQSATTACCNGSRIPYTLNKSHIFFFSNLSPEGNILSKAELNLSHVYDFQKLHEATHPRSFPDHASYPVALVEERVVDGGETGILEEEATLQALPLQGGVVLPLKGLDGGEHPAALEQSWTHSENLSNKVLLPVPEPSSNPLCYFHSQRSWGGRKSMGLLYRKKREREKAH